MSIEHILYDHNSRVLLRLLDGLGVMFILSDTVESSSSSTSIDGSVLLDESDEESELSGNLEAILDFFLRRGRWPESDSEVVEGAERLGMMMKYGRKKYTKSRHNLNALCQQSCAICFFTSCFFHIAGC